MDHIKIGDGSTSFVGPHAVDVMRLATLISGLRFELRCPGIKISKHGSALKFAKSITGLKTNDRQKHLDRAMLMLEAAKREVVYVTPGEDS